MTDREPINSGMKVKIDHELASPQTGSPIFADQSSINNRTSGAVGVVTEEDATTVFVRHCKDRKTAAYRRSEVKPLNA